MKKMSFNFLMIFLFLFLLIEILTNSSMVMESVKFSFSIWMNHIFPSLFPFFVLSRILMEYGFLELCAEILSPFMQTLFRSKGDSAFILIMSIISGFPSNAKYTKALYQDGILEKREAEKMLTFTHFSNPLFILGTIAETFLGNKKVGFLILACHYSTNILIGLLFRNYTVSPKKQTHFSIENILHKIQERRKENKSFSSVLGESLIDTIQTLLLILGTVTVFLIVTTIINQKLHFHPYYQSLLNGFFEMTQGLKSVSLLPSSLRLKATLSTMIISFGGLSVHMQMMGILSDTDISYLPFLVARIFHSALASILMYFLFDFII